MASGWESRRECRNQRLGGKTLPQINIKINEIQICVLMLTLKVKKQLTVTELQLDGQKKKLHFFATSG